MDVWPMLVNELISTLAPREGSDRSDLGGALCPLNFNPRSPRGERLRLSIWEMRTVKFQPSLPARGATHHH